MFILWLCLITYGVGLGLWTLYYRRQLSEEPATPQAQPSFIDKAATERAFSQEQNAAELKAKISSLKDTKLNPASITKEKVSEVKRQTRSKKTTAAAIAKEVNHAKTELTDGNTKLQHKNDVKMQTVGERRSQNKLQ